MNNNLNKNKNNRNTFSLPNNRNIFSLTNNRNTFSLPQKQNTSHNNNILGIKHTLINDILLITYDEKDISYTFEDVKKEIDKCINEINKINPPIIIVCTQNSVSGTDKHFQHHLSTSLIGGKTTSFLIKRNVKKNLKLNNKNYKLFSKIDATKKQDSSKSYRLLIKPSNVRTRIYIDKLRVNLLNNTNKKNIKDKMLNDSNIKYGNLNKINKIINNTNKKNINENKINIIDYNYHRCTYKNVNSKCFGYISSMLIFEYNNILYQLSINNNRFLISKTVRYNELYTKNYITNEYITNKNKKFKKTIMSSYNVTNETIEVSNNDLLITLLPLNNIKKINKTTNKKLQIYNINKKIKEIKEINKYFNSIIINNLKKLKNNKLKNNIIITLDGNYNLKKSINYNIKKNLNLIDIYDIYDIYMKYEPIYYELKKYYNRILRLNKKNNVNKFFNENLNENIKKNVINENNKNVLIKLNEGKKKEINNFKNQFIDILRLYPNLLNLFNNENPFKKYIMTNKKLQIHNINKKIKEIKDINNTLKKYIDKYNNGIIDEDLKNYIFDIENNVKKYLPIYEKLKKYYYRIKILNNNINLLNINKKNNKLIIENNKTFINIILNKNIINNDIRLDENIKKYLVNLNEEIKKETDTFSEKIKELYIIHDNIYKNK